MDFTTYFRALDAAQKRKLAAKLNTNLVYLFQIAGGKRQAGVDLAQRIAKATPIKLERLRPDIWGKSGRR